MNEMRKDWYIIYTKPKSEKKVAHALSKRKIENFLPITLRPVTIFRRKRFASEPLFESFVFAHLVKNEMTEIKMIDGVINFVYWKGAPATIPPNEIKAIREFVNVYQDIRLEKISVNQNSNYQIARSDNYSGDASLITINNTQVRLSLPSIGYIMTAEIIWEEKAVGKFSSQETNSSARRLQYIGENNSGVR